MIWAETYGYWGSLYGRDTSSLQSHSWRSCPRLAFFLRSHLPSRSTEFSTTERPAPCLMAPRRKQLTSSMIIQTSRLITQTKASTQICTLTQKSKHTRVDQSLGICNNRTPRLPSWASNQMTRVTMAADTIMNHRSDSTLNQPFIDQTPVLRTTWDSPTTAQ